MKEPIVNVFPSDGTMCGLARLIWPAKALATEGKLVTVIPRSPQIAVDPVTKKIVGINIGNANVVIFQRPASVQMPQIIEILQYNGVKVILDVDDSLSKIDPRNAAFNTYDPRTNHKTNFLHAAQACSMADLVTVTTEALAEEYGSHGRVAIIPNHIPQQYLTIPRPQNEVPVVGWAGWTKTHVHDLYETSGMISQVMSETNARFAAFGDDNILYELGIKNRPPHQVWGFEPISEYPYKLSKFDIGLVPLKKSDFNKAKSWLKGLEYASLGIVPVVTPIGDYVNFIDAGMGVPASTPKEWHDRVKELVEDHEMRQELSLKVREIASEYTFEANTEKWWTPWSSVVNG